MKQIKKMELRTIQVSPYILAQGYLFKVEGKRAWVDVDGTLVYGELV